MTKWPVQKPTHKTTQKHVKHQDATDNLENNYFCGFWDFYFLFSFLFIISLTYLSNVTLPQYKFDRDSCKLFLCLRTDLSKNILKTVLI